ncbi:unnamed protein product [Strongylus vulgaris]|uniref:Uncharacterized protein n=1 Tax=Strongylus vulgaris TaxID=40348 RepID=A0A3P7J6V1_STRVU|nr:unnamed protein product [Strongylus vulgaris]
MTALTSGSALDLNSLFEMLYANVRMASTEDGQRMGPPPVVSSDTVAAVHLFQQVHVGFKNHWGLHFLFAYFATIKKVWPTSY